MKYFAPAVLLLCAVSRCTAELGSSRLGQPRNLQEPELTVCTNDEDCRGSTCIQSTCAIVSEDARTYYYQQGSSGDGSSATSPSGDMKTLASSLDGGDTLMLMGAITNPSYNPSYTFANVSDPEVWNTENTLSYSKLRGSPGKYITITSYDENTVLKGNGGNILRLMYCQYLRLVNLHIYGETERISVETATALQFMYIDKEGNMKHRLDDNMNPEAGDDVSKMAFPKVAGVTRPSYTNTRGFYASDCDHIVIENSRVHHAPGTGLRVAKSEYVDIVNNEVHDCSRKSYAGTHGMVPTKTKDKISNDPAGVYRMRVLRNKVYNNYNEIYSWAPTKTIITPHVDEGKGISLQRNRNWNNGGRILVANNVAYGNGFSGLHSNDGKNIDFVGNTAYMNSYTNSVFYDGIVGGNSVGISVQGGRNNTLINNIAFIDTDTKAFPYSIGRQSVVEALNNIAFGTGEGELKSDAEYDAIQIGGITKDPLFVDADAGNFRLKIDSPAKGEGNAAYASLTIGDFLGNARSIEFPSIGALE